MYAEHGGRLCGRAGCYTCFDLASEAGFAQGAPFFAQGTLVLHSGRPTADLGVWQAVCRTRGILPHPTPACMRPLLTLCAFLLGGLLLTSCDSQSDEDCEVFQTCDVDDTLSLTLLERSAQPPANVSVLFKVDTDDNRPVAGLRASSFDLYENENRVSNFEADLQILPKTGQFQYSIVLLLDLSGSIVRSESLELLREAAQRFVQALLYQPDEPQYGEIEMGVWWFDGQAQISPLVEFTIRPDSLENGVATITADLPADPSTNLYGAIVQGASLAEQRVLSRRSRDVITAGSLVLFTDGTDQANRTSRSAALRAVEGTGADLSVFTIGLGGEIDTTTLESVGRDGFASASNLDELVPKFQEIADLVRDEANSYYLLEYCSPKRGGENELTLRANNGASVGLLTTTFSATDFTPGCSVVTPVVAEGS